MSFNAGYKLVMAGWLRLQDTQCCSAIQFYKSSGGGRFRKSWRTVGFFLEQSEDNRLVYEFLHLRSKKMCVLRVFWDGPLSFLYARKLSTAAPFDPGSFDEASRIFAAECEKIGPPPRGFETTTAKMAKMSLLMRVLLSKAFLPVPPPIDLNSMLDAPSGGDDAR